jgi:putative transposase
MLDRTRMLCRHVDNAALDERREAGQKCGVSVGYDAQKAELPEYSEVHRQVLQDVVQRGDRAFQASFRRVQVGETPGYPRFHGRTRSTSLTYPQFGNSLTYPQFGNGATLDNGSLMLSTIGRIAVRWSRPMEGTPKTITISREADGW